MHNKLSIAVITCLALAGTVNAQPAVTGPSDLPVAGYVDSASLIGGMTSPGPSGAGVVWDFSGFTVNFSDVCTVGSPQGTQYESEFSGAGAVLRKRGPGVQDRYDYYKFDANGFYRMSENYSYGTWMAGTVYRYTVAKMVLPFPFRYGDRVSSAFEGSNLSGATVMGTDELLYDGYGTLKTPVGTDSNVIRIKYSDNIYVWFSSSPVRILATYWTSGSGVGVMEIHSAARYTSLNVPMAFNGQHALQIIPNPAVDAITVRATVEANTAGRCRLVDVTGRLVGDVPFKDGMSMFSRGSLSAGVYVCQLWVSGKMLGHQRLVFR